jgi:hypothetical protein
MIVREGAKAATPWIRRSAAEICDIFILFCKSDVEMDYCGLVLRFSYMQVKNCFQSVNSRPR